jgi:hypothetical protein
MAVTKFHRKNQALFAKVQTVEGTYETGIVGTDAIPITSIDGSVTTETGSYQYLGDALSRDETSFTKDQYAEFTAETPQQVLGTLNASIAVADVPHSATLQACGGYITVLGSALGSFAAGTVIVDNSRVSDTLISIDRRLTSAQDAVNQKLYKFFDCRGMVDVSADVGDLPKLKFSFKGNAADPIAAAILATNFQAQTTRAVAPIRQANIVTAQLASITDAFTTITPAVSTITKTNNIATVTFASAHSLGANGSIRAITVGGATDTLYNGVFVATVIATDKVIYNMVGTPSADASGTLTCTKGSAPVSFCFSSFQAPNFFGFDYARYITGCEEGFSKTAIATDVNISILEDQAGTSSFDPDANISNFYGAQVKFGTAAGKYITYKWDKLQISNVKSGAVADFLGRDTTLRNTGKSYIIYE